AGACRGGTVRREGRSLESAPMGAAPIIQVSASSPAARRLTVGVLLSLAVVHVFLTRLSWGEIPLQTDAGIWSYIGWRVGEGKRLYTDLWDSKPPGIYWFFAACVRAGGAGRDRTAFWLDAAVSVSVLAVCWRLARRFAGPAASAAAVFVAGLVCCHRILA